MQAGRALQHIFHLPDGPEQQSRDADMRRAMALERALDASPADGAAQTAGNPNHWADRDKSDRQFSYDADVEVERWWTEVGCALPVFCGPEGVL
jgi:salicylate hydroxylase